MAKAQPQRLSNFDAMPPHVHLHHAGKRNSMMHPSQIWHIRRKCLLPFFAQCAANVLEILSEWISLIIPFEVKS